MRRLIALTAAIDENDPDNASTSDTAEVNVIAIAGVRKRACTRPNRSGTSPFSASANRLRDPDSAWPMLLPDIEMAAPAVIISAPHDPRKRADASASGVFDAASAGRVP